MIEAKVHKADPQPPKLIERAEAGVERLPAVTRGVLFTDGHVEAIPA